MRNNRLFLALSLLVVTSMLLVACGGAATTAAPQPTDEPMAEPTEAMAEPTEEPMEPALGTADNPVVWVLTPSQDTQTVLAGAEGIAQYIEDQTGIVIDSFVATDYTSQVEAMCSGEADMGAINTFGYVRAADRGCADAALASERFGSTSYAGQI
ncbi:MAG: PhnD/SsuA/transferrin family substrate-binding protein, partial [Anaerolineales bacterium]